MNTTLRTATASCEIKTLGAELVHFKRLDTGVDYLWNADPAFWASSAPVLFPIVAAVNGGKAHWAGQAYPIGNHGFVRKDEFTLVEASATRAVFRHLWSEKTLAQYPCKYALTLIYTLTGNELEIRYQVENVDEKEILFQIGTHPGFRCPLVAGEKFEDYFLEFEKDEAFERFYMSPANTTVVGKSQRLNPGKLVPLTHELFHEGALVFKKMASKKVTLKSRQSAPAVVLTWDNLPAMGIWQAKNAPFVCLEPWHGLADDEDFTGDFSQKSLVVTLARGKIWECWHKIELV